MNDRINSGSSQRPAITGWASWLARFSMAVLVFEAVSGLAITLSPFHAAVQWSVLVHTVVGALTLLPLAWYCARHWLDYRRYAWTHNRLLGYVGLLALTVCSLSGAVLTGQGLFGVRSAGWLRQTHLISTFATLGAILPHLFFSWIRVGREGRAGAVAATSPKPLARRSSGWRPLPA